jgi:chloride channel protein, CIC family
VKEEDSDDELDEPGASLERRRVPQPLIKRRLPSGRGATEQPNATGDEAAPLNSRFWIALVLTGVATGLFADLLMWILFSVQHLAFDYHSGYLENAVERADDLRRISSLLIAGAIGGPAWFLLRTFTKGKTSEVDDAIWAGNSRLSFGRCLGTGLISELVIGMGASIGREQAPKLMGAASGGVLSGWFRLSDGQRRLLVACGAGAGLAAVYNVPLGGALFTLEVLLGVITLPTALPAIACSVVATAVAWIYLPTHATYVGIPSYSLSGTLVAWSVAAGIVIGVFSSGYIRLIGWVSHHRISGLSATFAPLVAFSILGLVGFAYPQLFGNGKDVARDVFLGQGTLTLVLALLALKPVVTALCLESGASGGLFTPTLCTGALAGAFLGIGWSHLWAGSPVGAFAMVGATAMIGAAMQAPIAGIVLVLELTHSGFGLTVPMAIATVIATLIARHVDGYSIYSARLPARARDAPSATTP